MSTIKAKRFWTDAKVVERAGGYGVNLDQRELKTPAKSALVLPTSAAAEAIVQEWAAVDAHIDPGAMPATRWANAAIDKVIPQQAAVADMLAEYGGSDLLCYRAAGPDGLVARQAAAWDGPLDWARRELAAPLVVTQGVLPVDQPGASLANLRAVLGAYDPFGLAAVHDLVTLTGSLILGLATARGALDPATAWEASRVDEAWQIAQWGADAEAESLAAAKEADFMMAARLLETLSR